MLLIGPHSYSIICEIRRRVGLLLLLIIGGYKDAEFDNYDRTILFLRMFITGRDTIFVSIGSNAFAKCLSLNHIVITSSVKAISDFAFMKCRSLCQIEIPSSVVFVGSSIFKDCTSLKQLTIPVLVYSYGEYLFSQNSLENHSDFENAYRILQIPHKIDTNTI